MLRWREVYERVKSSQQYRNWFQGRAMDQFRFTAYSQLFTGVPAAAQVGSYGSPTGPVLQSFPSGAIVLGITASAIQAQTTASDYRYAPSASPGRRDLFGLNFMYSGDEVITPGGPVQAEALLGSGLDTIFPAREIMLPPTQGILTTVASLTVAPVLSVTVVYHCMVPR